MEIKRKDVLDDIKDIADKDINIIFSDPPYSLGSEIYIDKDGKPKYRQARDFMDKWEFGADKWEMFFKQAFRVLKHGGFCLLFGMDRQLFLIQYYAQLAGFEIMQSMYWYFCSSFPKATDCSKQIDKRLGMAREVVGTRNAHDIRSGALMEATDERIKKENSIMEYEYTKPASDLAKEFNGYKYSIAPLKQTLETIMIFRKPCKTSPLNDIMEWNENRENGISPSCLAIDKGRVPIDKHEKNLRLNAKNHITNKVAGINCYNKIGLNDERKKGKDRKEFISDLGFHNSSGRYPSQLFLDKKCAEIIDKQSGVLTSGELKAHPNKTQNSFLNKGKGFMSCEINTHVSQANSGGASRINHICDYEKGEFDLLNYEPKVSSEERGKSNHPTMKPIKLITKILELFKLPCKQKIYIPFSGSGSEIIGAIKAGFKNIRACEIDKEYIKISKARINYHTRQLTFEYS